MRIEEYFAYKNPYIVSSNGIPLTPPFRAIPGDADYRAAMRHYEQRKLDDQVLALLQSNNIPFLSMTILRREKYQYNRVDTLTIVTDNGDSSCWGRVAREIRDLILRQSLFKKIDVEISHTKHGRLMKSAILSDDPQTLGALKTVRPLIEQEVQSSNGLQWSSIAYHNRSPEHATPEDVIKPTVLLFVEPLSTLDYESLESRLLSILAMTSIPLWLEILPGTIVSCAQRRSASDPLPREPETGSSIGIREDVERAGSLGFYAWAHMPDRPPQKMGCTAFHVVVHTDIHIKRTHDSGVRREQDHDEGKLAVLYPAYCDGLEEVRLAEADVKNEPGSESAQRAAVAKDLMRNPYLGTVRMASGLRWNKAGRRMDWALFTAQETFKQNVIPPADAFGRWQECPRSYRRGNNCVTSKFGKVTDGEWLTKYGRTSFTTAGYVNRMDRKVHWREYNMGSTEIEVIGLGNAFAEPGDSGSAVINSRGEIVGLLIGMEPGNGTENAGLVTPIEDLLADIEQREGVTLELP